MTSYPAKLLLFGEHTVNAGSQALAVPLPLFSGRWVYRPSLSHTELAAKQMLLPQLAEYLEKLQSKGELLAKLDVAAFKKALTGGLVFESNIPTGYGAGSSGAVVAAVYGSWQMVDGHVLEDFHHLKGALAQMETFFHGTSSGTDPLICYLQKPLLLSQSTIKTIALPVDLQTASHYQLFLLDTGMPRKATPLIEYFLGKMSEHEFAEKCQAELVPAVNLAIAAFLDGNGNDVFEAVQQIGAFQLSHLEKLIPDQFRAIWRQGLNGNVYKLKICGAGGGGFILGVARDFEAAKNALAAYRLLPVGH